MTMIDAQIHVWNPDTPSRPWPPGRAAYAHGRSLSAEEVLRVMDGAGVARAVLVPPSWIGDDNSDALTAARAHPDRFAVMGRFDPTAPGAEGRLRPWLSEPGMLGIRLTFHLPLWRAWLGDGTPETVSDATLALSGGSSPRISITSPRTTISSISVPSRPRRPSGSSASSPRSAVAQKVRIASWRLSSAP